MKMKILASLGNSVAFIKLLTIDQLYINVTYRYVFVAYRSTSLKRHMHICVICSYIYNIQDIEST